MTDQLHPIQNFLAKHKLYPLRGKYICFSPLICLYIFLYILPHIAMPYSSCFGDNVIFVLCVIVCLLLFVSWYRLVTATFYALRVMVFCKADIYFCYHFFTWPKNNIPLVRQVSNSPNIELANFPMVKKLMKVTQFRSREV